MSNINIEGNYLDALKELERSGGILFKPKKAFGSSEPTTLQLGQKTLTYWPEGSYKKREELVEIAEKLKIPENILGNPWNLTSGRLARKFLDTIIKAKNFNADPHPKKYAKYYGKEKYLPMAKEGSHWRFEYFNTQEPCYAIELDIKSAYFTSLLNLDSLFLHEKMGFRPDGGAIERLRGYAPILSQYKFFRLQLLGILSSHSKEFIKRDEKGNLLEQELESIEWGSAFNAVHEAIKRLYTAMEHSAQMLGKYLIRSHTDCLLIRADCPEEVEKRVVNYLTQKGFSLACKEGKIGYRIGLSKFWELNTGFIGRYTIPKSMPKDIRERIKEEGIDIEEIYKPIPQEIIKRWEDWLF